MGRHGAPQLAADHTPLYNRVRHRHLFTEIHIVYRIQQFDAVFHWALEGLAAGDEAHAAGALVDDGSAHCLGQVAGPRADKRFLNTMI
ncbi:MAG TPA: hypothetical protein VN285_08070 [Candidatus Deferrimicrobium sp.]|nr:hypothetical protein [Candidatus Deferrimicrobium sp.]